MPPIENQFGDLPRPALAPEDRLCLLLARRSVSEDMRSQALQLLASPLRWPTILEQAYAHQIYPLLYQNLRGLDFEGVPEDARAELAAAFRRNALYALSLAAELAFALRVLNAAAIPALALKGFALAQSLYGDVALRVCADVDILVHSKQVAQAVNMLVASGYRDSLNHRFFSRLAMRYGRHYSVVREVEDNSYLIELHWSLLQGSSREQDAMDDVWSGSCCIKLLEEPARVLSGEWEFLYLCIHAADHGWQALRWLVDIHEFCLAKKLDWELVKQRAEELELDQVVRQTLTICSTLLGTPLPSSFERGQLPSKPPLFPATPYYHGSSEAAFFHLHVLKRIWDKLRFAAAVVFIPKPSDCDFLRLPHAVSFLYYGVRVVRLLIKWSWTATRNSMNTLVSSLRSSARPTRDNGAA